MLRRTVPVALTALLAGLAVPTTAGDIRAGVLKGLAVTSARRAPVLPNVPTLSELAYPELKNLDVNSWVGLVAPAKTPSSVVARLDAALQQVLASDDMQNRLLAAGSTPVKSSPELFARQISADLSQWKKVILESRLRLEA